jgi:hypothetical protein
LSVLDWTCSPTATPPQTKTIPTITSPCPSTSNTTPLVVRDLSCDRSSIVSAVSAVWALLNSSLDFIYLDPVLASNLSEQSNLLLGKSLITYVHPDEQASAKHDIGGVVERKTMHGSITRFVSLLFFRLL